MSIYASVGQNGSNLNQYMDEPAPVNYSMSKGVLGSYGGIKLKTPCKGGWRKPPCVEKVKKR